MIELQHSSCWINTRNPTCIVGKCSHQTGFAVCAACNQPIAFQVVEVITAYRHIFHLWVLQTNRHTQQQYNLKMLLYQSCLKISRHHKLSRRKRLPPDIIFVSISQIIANTSHKSVLRLQAKLRSREWSTDRYTERCRLRLAWSVTFLSTVPIIWIWPVLFEYSPGRQCKQENDPVGITVDITAAFSHSDEEYDDGWGGEETATPCIPSLQVVTRTYEFTI